MQRAWGYAIILTAGLPDRAFRSSTMRNLIASTVLIAGIAFSGAAFAEDQTVNGTIKSFDAQTRVVMLEDGNSYKLGKKADASAIQVGEDVVITLRQNKKGVNVAREVKAAE